jgi:protein tyrosine phosphatase (PTP) superfamily phosphohydrolase (DUF442 family)
VGKQKAVILVVLTFAVLAGISATASTSNSRPPDWANSIRMEGVPNFYKVSDNLYRSAQPTSAEAMHNLETSSLRIRAVVNLCWSQSDRDKMNGTGLISEHIPMMGWPLFPKEKQVIKFLQIVTDNQKTPILVHCQHGADRTGIMCAVYRIAVQGWTKEKAVKEMIEGGFGFHGFRDGNVVQWIDGLNIDKIRRKAGIRESALY